MPVIDVGLIFEDIETAYKFLIKYAANAQKAWLQHDYAFRYYDNLLCFTFIKADTELFKGQRYDVVFTTEEVVNSEWYKRVGSKFAAGGCEVLCRKDGIIVAREEPEYNA